MDGQMQTISEIQELETTQHPKVLIAATHPLQCTGYARVGCTIANGLAERGHDVVYWGYQNLAPASGRTMHDRVQVVDVAQVVGDGWSFGESHLPACVADTRPDTCILYNDVMVLNRFLDAVYANGKPSCRVVSYVDLVHDDEDSRLIDGIVRRSDQVWVFADHWKTRLAETYPDRASDIHVVPHGVDPAMLDATATTKAEARATINLPQDAFVVVNSNRNSYRKALDLTIDGFLQFWKTHGDSVLVLNNNAAIDSGYDIPGLVVASCRRHAIDDVDTVLRSVVLSIQNGGFMPDRLLALLHIASDVGVNTCLGEGFGLCQLEGACLGVPQIATRTGGLVDILGDDPAHTFLDPVVHLAIPRGFVAHGGTCDVPSPNDLARALERVYDTRPSVDTDRIRARYAWAPVLDRVSDLIQ